MKNIPTKRKGRAVLHPNITEFTCANTSGALIRKAFRPVIHGSADCLSPNRLSKALLEVIRTDTTSEWGNRTVANGNIELLRGFEFNGRKTVSKILLKQPAVTINPVTGFCCVLLPSLLPRQDLCYDAHYSHVRFTAAAGSFDFAQAQYRSYVTTTDYLAAHHRTAIELAPLMTVQDGFPIFLLLGIEFFQAVNGRYYCICRGGSIALQIVAVERGIVEQVN